MDITFTVDNAKVDRVINAMEGLYPIPTDESGTPLFTPTQWAKESIRRWIRNQVARWEQRVAIKAVEFTPDDTLVT